MHNGGILSEVKKMNKELILEAVSAAIDFNNGNEKYHCSVCFGENTLRLWIAEKFKSGFIYYENSGSCSVYGLSNEENAKNFIKKLKELECGE